LIKQLLARNLYQWKLEDQARDDNLTGDQALALIRKIQASNRDRVSIMENIDRQYFNSLKPFKTATNYCYSETPGELIDKLSILYIRLHYYKGDKNIVLQIKDQIRATRFGLFMIVAAYNARRMFPPTWQRNKLYGNPS
jgi:hypothetical protein